MAVILSHLMYTGVAKTHLTKLMSSDAQPIQEQHAILIVEDDREQMDLLVNFVLNETRKIIDKEDTTPWQRDKLKSIKVLKIGDLSSLKKVASLQVDIVLALMDCNIPDEKGGKSHDQFVKTNHRITGQHASVDLIIDRFPSAPIVMTSSMNRFQKLVTQYYKSKHDLNLKFVKKSEVEGIQDTIGLFLKAYVENQSQSL